MAEVEVLVSVLESVWEEVPGVFPVPMAAVVAVVVVVALALVPSLWAEGTVPAEVCRSGRVGTDWAPEGLCLAAVRA